MAVRKDKRKGWIVDFIFEHANGTSKRVRKRSPVQTKRGAQTYERQLREELLNPKLERKEVPTLNTFSKEFMTTYVASNNKPSTQADKESILRVHLKPALGKRRLDDIGVREVEQLKAKLLKRELSPKTVNNILGVLSKLLGYAVEIEVLDSKPRIKPLKVPPSKFDFLTFEEYEKLIAVIDTEELWGSAILAAGEGGYRLGEILGMHQEDTDHKAELITVRRASWNGILGTPKGGRDRKVPMTKRLAKKLRGERHLKSDYVWCDLDGKPFTKKMAERAIQRVCKRAKLRPVGWHVLRHTWCSHLAMRGAAPKAIQDLAGHRDITTTMKYMHLAPTALREAVALLDR